MIIHVFLRKAFQIDFTNCENSRWRFPDFQLAKSGGVSMPLQRQLIAQPCIPLTFSELKGGLMNYLYSVKYFKIISEWKLTFDCSKSPSEHP